MCNFALIRKVTLNLHSSQSEHFIGLLTRDYLEKYDTSLIHLFYFHRITKIKNNCFPTFIMSV